MTNLLFKIIKNKNFQDGDFVVVTSRIYTGWCLLSFSSYFNGYVYYMSEENYIIYEFSNNIRRVIKALKINSKLELRTRRL